ncbi:hypothetical protein BAUCODRAFT_36847 [Baudoinia panamericana UAMH 10762]|uniref:Heme haloperoxidase family profile domain-containing protein n=1 Tax=Baudoinia panamericana (strain UAMH 10762) TaxID=717646 RepID=M2M9R5_BAUPA|nr:uncharacterized protein BAUCODRAFT_36847 [Baudoinia panamericana UAMH 10762]EMC93181.1 hypothetical protein BAUCODRAFT_36847 [Baudoinia panamericana UAMH 10762]
MGGFSWSHLFTPILSLFRPKPNAEIEALKEANHDYIRGDESQRSPCPFLNSLANHNYLPRDGKAITKAKLKAALIVAGNSTPLFADVLSSIVKSVTRKDGTFTLVDLRRHNAVEHDASFTRLDARQGDNYTFQPAMFEAMVKDAHGGPINRDSIARTRARRDREEKAAGNGAGVTFWRSPRLYVTTWSQACILLQTFGEEIGVEELRKFYTEERLVEGWVGEKKKRMTFLGQLGDMASVWWKHFFIQIDGAAVKDPLKGW